MSSVLLLMLPCSQSSVWSIAGFGRLAHTGHTLFLSHSCGVLSLSLLREWDSWDLKKKRFFFVDYHNNDKVVNLTKNWDKAFTFKKGMELEHGWDFFRLPSSLMLTFSVPTCLCIFWGRGSVLAASLQLSQCSHNERNHANVSFRAHHLVNDVALFENYWRWR